MKLRPLSDCIVIKQHEEETKTASGIILAFDGPQKKFQGEVMACGTGEIRENGTVRPMAVNVGDIVMFGEYSGQKFRMDGQEYLMMREKDIIGIIEDEPTEESLRATAEKFYKDNTTIPLDKNY